MDSTFDWILQPLHSEHDRSSFSCGEPSLDSYLRERANQHQKENYGQTFVAVRPGDVRILAYYTLAAAEIAFENVPLALKLPKHPMPTVLLGRLAVDQRSQRLRMGTWLMGKIFRQCDRIAKEMGVHAISVHALHETAAAYYRRFGFESVLDNPLHMYLPIAVVRKLLESEV